MRKTSRESKIALAAMLIIVVVVVATVLVLRPFNSTSYVSAQADKESYTIGEDITFKLVAQSSPLGHFRSLGTSYNYGVYINKVPDGVSPDEFVANYTSWILRAVWPENESPQVTFGNFDSGSGPLELRWNGMYRERNDTTGHMVLRSATSGYYFILPQLLPTEGYIQVKVERSSIFYLDSLNVSFGYDYQRESGNLTLDLTIGGLQNAAVNGTLESSLHYLDAMDDQPYSNITLEEFKARYLNTSVNASAGGTWTGSLTVSSAYLDGSQFSLVGTLVTADGTYTFGVYANIKDGVVSAFCYR